MTNNPQDNLPRLQEIFRDVLDEPGLQVTRQFSMEDHPDWDSVATVQIVLAAEEAFQMRFQSDAVGKIQSVGDILAMIDHHGGSG